MAQETIKDVITNINYELRFIRDSNLFDEVWYLNKYPDVGISGINPLIHFLKYGGKLGRNPGPRFDTNAYLKLYIDVAQEGMNPLYHYLRFGIAEGRVLPFSDELTCGSQSDFYPLEKCGKTQGLRIAIVAHVFYPELWDEIKQKLFDYSDDFTLFVTLPQESSGTISPLILADFSTARIFPVENTGMDIGPFISLIPVIIEEGYDLVCKIHTKKGRSLYQQP